MLLADRARHLGTRAHLESPSELRTAVRPTVSVVVPCYNYAHFLPRAVQSALDQRGVDVEVIVVDDASTDDSLAVARQLATRHPQVRVVAHETNKGHIQTYNDGFAQVSGDYWALVSADDLLAPDALSRAAAVMERDPATGMVYGPIQYFGSDVPEARTSWSGTARWGGHDWLERRARRANNVIASPEVVVRTSVQREVGPYRADLPHAGDLEMWLRVSTVADVARLIGPDQAFYRLHGENMHVTRFKQHDAAGVAIDIRERRAAFDAWREFAQDRDPEHERVWRLSRRALAREALLEGLAATWYSNDAVVDELVDLAQTLDGTSTEMREYALLQRSRTAPRSALERAHRLANRKRLGLRRRYWTRRRQWTGT